MAKCKRQTVIAVLITTDGQYFIGKNTCKRTVDVCPRDGMEPGEGYDLCKCICGQEHHAEVDACVQAGEDAKDAVVLVFGHIKCCPDCESVMRRHGVQRWECFGGWIDYNNYPKSGGVV